MCGLFGFIGTDPKECFTWDKFNILGWFNDSRGGDACGRIYGNVCQHGLDTQKTYKEFAIKIKNPLGEVSSNVILGHCRKASSGGKDNIYAQPIIITKKDLNAKMIKDPVMKTGIKSLKADDIVFSGIHNGTIDNYLDLAPQYGIPTAEHNDSKVLLNILFYGNYKVLAQYVGTASIVWHNHILNRTFLFKGSSKAYSGSTNDTEERPLYYWSMKKDNYYFSSIDDSLLFIGAKKEDIVDIKCNTLFTLQSGELIKETEFDRSLCFQNEYAVNLSTNKGIRRSKSFGQNSFYNHYDWHRDERDARIFEGGIKSGFTVVKRPLDDFVRTILTCGMSRRIQAEIYNKFTVSRILRRAVYNKGRYWMNGGLMHGVYVLNSIGIVPNKMTKDSACLGVYYFIEGAMMDNATAYAAALKFHTEFIQELLASPKIDVPDKEQKLTADIAKYSRYPLPSLTRTDGSQDCYPNVYGAAGSSKYYTGSFQPLFSNRTYNFSTGDLSSIIEEADGDKKAFHDDATLTACYEYYENCSKEETLLDKSYLKGQVLLDDEDALNILSPFQNVFFIEPDFNNITDSKLRFMLIHYLRDFNEDLKSKCSLCHNDKLSILVQCTTCVTLKFAFDNTINKLTYDFS